MSEKNIISKTDIRRVLIGIVVAFIGIPALVVATTWMYGNSRYHNEKTQLEQALVNFHPRFERESELYLQERQLWGEALKVRDQRWEEQKTIVRPLLLNWGDGVPTSLLGENQMRLCDDFADALEQQYDLKMYEVKKEYGSTGVREPDCAFVVMGEANTGIAIHRFGIKPLDFVHNKGYLEDIRKLEKLPKRGILMHNHDETKREIHAQMVVQMQPLVFFDVVLRRDY